jgi:hypothetical protein
MIEITEHTRNVLLEVAKKKKIYVEGNFLKLLKAPKGDKEFEEYLSICKEKDTTARKKRLSVTKQVQSQNKELEKAAKDNEQLLVDLQVALDEARVSEQEASKAKAEAEKLRDEAVEDLDMLQKRTQFELIGLIVKVALIIIIGVGVTTTLLYSIAMLAGEDTTLLGNAWSNMFGILLTNSFSIIGTIMGVKYATEKSE